jgi:hypothetical protein
MALRRNVSISDYFGFCCLVDVWFVVALQGPSRSYGQMILRPLLSS